MAQITIEVPDEVYSAIELLAGVKGQSFDDFCFLAFVAGLNKNIRKKIPR